ncbi:DoxX family protein [Luteococcus sp. Sow4_B9]|uniref:DoxX family protein n=1 Tax=Luteococcus sp. Sow4_B9 TaxID=3438792 RepID=UPI003F9D2B3D
MTDNQFDSGRRSGGGSTEATQILQSDSLREAQEAAALAEADDRAAQRARERAERDRALGKVAAPQGPDPVLPEIPKPTTDKFGPSLGLFLLRLVTGGIMAVHGVQKLTDIAGTQDFLTQLGLPSPHYLAWGTGIAEVLAGVALLFGLLTRLAGLGVAVVAIAALALVKWGASNPFQAGKPGFTGELELLLAAVGLTLLFVGAGRWSIDGSIRAGRRRAKQNR